MRATDKLRASAPAGAPFSKPSAMMIFVVEIMGRSIAAFNAESKIAGEAFIGEEWFRSDLMALERDGTPLWDGKSEIYLREALAEEADQWRLAYARAQFKSIEGWMHAGCYILSRCLIRLTKEGRSWRK
jgi:hypothetical protein